MKKVKKKGSRTYSRLRRVPTASSIHFSPSDASTSTSRLTPSPPSSHRPATELSSPDAIVVALPFRFDFYEVAVVSNQKPEPRWRKEKRRTEMIENRSIRIWFLPFAINLPTSQQKEREELRGLLPSVDPASSIRFGDRSPVRLREERRKSILALDSFSPLLCPISSF